MKAKMIAVTLVLCFAGVAVCFAEDGRPQYGHLETERSQVKT